MIEAEGNTFKFVYGDDNHTAYKERQKQVCMGCGDCANCGFISRNLESDCPHMIAKMDGWELGWQDAIDKACEWLKFNYVEFTDNSRLGLNINELIKDFKKDLKKAMEE